MSSVVKAIKKVVKSAVDFIKDVVVTIWKEVIVPIIEEIVAIFGIVDELVVDVSKISTKLYSENKEPPSKNAIIRAVLGNSKDTDPTRAFFDHYWFQINSTKVSLTTYYRYGLNKSPEGLPDATMNGTSIPESALAAAVVSEFGTNATVKSASSIYPTELQHFQYVLQASPHNFKAPTSTLTHNDSVSGVLYSDWGIDEIFFNTLNSNYELTLTRQSELAQFWITGDESVIEGDTASYTVHSTRIVPAGKSITVDLVYGGTASGGDYTPVASVVMLEGTAAVSFSIPTIDNAAVDGNREFTISLGAIDNTGTVFETVATRVPSLVSTLIHDDEGSSLLVHGTTVAEGTPNVTVDVSLLGTGGIAFTVDYVTVGGTAIPGADYHTTSGTLSYVGTPGEIQNITVPILTDITDDSGETFSVVLSNCSEPSIDISSQGTVTITDNSAGFSAIDIAVEEILIQPNYVREQSLVVEYYLSSTAPSKDFWAYWIYAVNTNQHPSITPVSDTVTNLELFPLVVLRKNSKSLLAYGTAEEKKSAEAMLLILNMEIETVIDSIESNADISLVRDAYLNISVNPLDTGEGVSKLLWHLFYPIIAETPVASNEKKFFMTVEQGDIQNAVVWSAQTFKPTILGNIGNTNDYTHEIVGDLLRLRTQIDPNRYSEITISDLGTFAAIKYDGHHEVAANKLGDVDFTIAVSWYSINKLSPKEQMNVYEKIIRLDFYAIQETEIRWYETSAFATLFQIVMIIITIVSFGTSSPVTGPAAAASAATSTVVAITIAVAKQIAINYLISAVVSKIAQATGNEALAAIVGVVAAIAFSPGEMNLGNFASMVDAKQLLNLSINFADNLASSYKVTAAEDSKALGEEINEFNSAASARLDEIEEAEYTPIIDAEFSALLRSVDTSAVPAIDGIYQFDAIYNYDSLVGKYNENLLRVGVI